jgi:hypothetical protein
MSLEGQVKMVSGALSIVSESKQFYHSTKINKIMV